MSKQGKGYKMETEELERECHHHRTTLMPAEPDWRDGDAFVPGHGEYYECDDCPATGIAVDDGAGGFMIEWAV
jgi:hypothetical protein